MRERGTVRVNPRTPVTVAIDRDVRRHFGVVANISESGACIWTDGSFGVGDNIGLQLSFGHAEEPFPVAGRVVWSKPAAGDAHRYGLQWLPLPRPEVGRLRELIVTIR